MKICCLQACHGLMVTSVSKVVLAFCHRPAQLKASLASSGDIVWSCLYSKHGAADWENEIQYHLDPFPYASCTEGRTRPGVKTKRSIAFNVTFSSVGGTKFWSVPACLSPEAVHIFFCNENQSSKAAGTALYCGAERDPSTCRALLLLSPILTQLTGAWHGKRGFMQYLLSAECCETTPASTVWALGSSRGKWCQNHSWKSSAVLGNKECLLQQLSKHQIIPSHILNKVRFQSWGTTLILQDKAF